MFSVVAGVANAGAVMTLSMRGASGRALQLVAGGAGPVSLALASPAFAFPTGTAVHRTLF